MSNLVKIDEEMRPGECPQTDTHTHGQTQNDFIICPMLYAIAMGQIIIACCKSEAPIRRDNDMTTGYTGKSNTLDCLPVHII